MFGMMNMKSKPVHIDIDSARFMMMHDVCVIVILTIIIPFTWRYAGTTWRNASRFYLFRFMRIMNRSRRIMCITTLVYSVVIIISKLALCLHCCMQPPDQLLHVVDNWPQTESFLLIQRGICGIAVDKR